MGFRYEQFVARPSVYRGNGGKTVKRLVLAFLGHRRIQLQLQPKVGCWLFDLGGWQVARDRCGLPAGNTQIPTFAPSVSQPAAIFLAVHRFTSQRSRCAAARELSARSRPSLSRLCTVCTYLPLAATNSAYPPLSPVIYGDAASCCLPIFLHYDTREPNALSRSFPFFS